MVIRAHTVLRKLAEKLQAPVTSTILGMGGFPESHDLSVGMLGMHGTAYANKAVSECDLIFQLDLAGMTELLQQKLKSFVRMLSSYTLI